MAFMELHFFSDVLGRAVSACVILPERSVSLIGMEQGGSEESCCPTLWLLHGLSDDHTIWMRRSSIERYAAENGIAVVMPDGERSWYSDMANGGGDFFTYLTEELPAKCRSIYRCMRPGREWNMIAGLSMGGYGALKAAYTCPERYGAVTGLSSALLAESYRRDPAAANARFAPVFGQIDDFERSPQNVFYLAKRHAPAELPPTYLWCGEQDGLLGGTLALGEYLASVGVPHLLTHSEGDHSWRYWDENIARAIPWMLRRLRGEDEE